ncbi:MAG: hypothetical protein J6S96_00595 [Muribaculaceae bacterium]|nr:hypothetical protein [Muribaculaceae bacterium]
MATDLQQRLNRIVSKSNVLVEKYQQLLVLKQSAEEKLDQKQQEIEQLRQQVERLERENQYLRVARTLSTTPEQLSESRMIINRLVRDIDKCISQLNT